MFRTVCVVCGSSKLDSIIDLGLHPFADTFIEKSRASEPESVYPLICDLCNVCGQIQTKCSTDPIDRYSGHNYSYTSSNSTFSRNHWDQYCIDVSKIVPLGKRSLVVEIGSNDGFLAAKFLTRGHRVVGVDASPYMVDLAKERDIHTILGLFDSNISGSSNNSPHTAIQLGLLQISISVDCLLVRILLWSVQ